MAGPLYKTTGLMYAPFNHWTRIENPAGDPDFGSGAASFFEVNT
jgi:hypothetical protein